ncbi:MAG: hypothetical protein AAF223_01560, partial [Bacteroidota bacterium]
MLRSLVTVSYTTFIALLDISFIIVTVLLLGSDIVIRFCICIIALFGLRARRLSLVRPLSSGLGAGWFRAQAPLPESRAVPR